MELKMRRDLPGNIPNSELTIFTASDTFIRTPGSLRWLPPSSKNWLFLRIPCRNPDDHRGYQAATAGQRALLQIPGSVCKRLGGVYKHFRVLPTWETTCQLGFLLYFHTQSTYAGYGEQLGSLVTSEASRHEPEYKCFKQNFSKLFSEVSWLASHVLVLWYSYFISLLGGVCWIFIRKISKLEI